MSFWYDPKTRQPQMWTYLIFIAVTFAVIWGFFFYGGKKAGEKANQKIEESRKF